MDKFKYIIKEVLSFLITLAVMFVIIKVVYATVLEPFEVDGRSMEYTLHDGERMFMFKQANIERFDVIVFPDPIASNQKELLQETDSQMAEEVLVPLYVKRVIGVPGDSLFYEDGVLTINGQALDEPYLEQMEMESQGPFTNDFTLHDVTGLDQVPEGKLFVLGDNRRNSLDGRAFGFIDLEDVVGEANMVFWPLANIRLLDQYELSEDGSAIVVE